MEINRHVLLALILAMMPSDDVTAVSSKQETAQQQITRLLSENDHLRHLLIDTVQVVEKDAVKLQKETNDLKIQNQIIRFDRVRRTYPRG